MKANKFILLLLLLFFISGCQSQSKNSIKAALVETSYTDIDAAIVYYTKLKKEHPESYNFNDKNELNSLGYQLINDNRLEDAIKIFELLVYEFPTSANPYDSLGEAYLLNNDSELALKSYKKSLELNPENENAEKSIVNINFENRDKNKFYKVYPKQQYLDDLDELAKTLTTENPHPYKFMTKEDFWRVVEEKKSSITNNTTYSQFIWHCSELVANINCIHSGLWYFNQEDEMLPIELRFPLESRLMNDKFYVSNPSLNNIKKESEILAINGKNINEIKENIYRHITSQAKIETTKKVFLNSYFTAYIPYSLNFPKSYTITIKGKKAPIQLKQLSYYKPKPRYFPTNLCDGENLCLDYKNDSTAVLTIKNTDYYGNSFSIYKEFIDKSFKEINSIGIDYLIIDYRSNSGGPGNTAVYLLRYLAKEAFVYKKLSEGSNVAHKSFEPFDNRFKGKLYFLIDGEGGSTTGHMLSIVKELKLGTIVGEELGSNHFCTGGQRQFKLTNTDVFYSVGRFTNVTAVNALSDDRGIMPDHFVKESIQDYLNDIDTVMEYTLELIQGN